MKKPEHRPTSAAVFKPLIITFLILAAFLIALMPIAYRDIEKAGLSYHDYTAFRYTFDSLYYTSDSDSDDRAYYLNIKESDKPLHITSLLDTNALRSALSGLRSGDVLTGYAAEEEDCLETVELVTKRTLFSLEEYNRTLRQNGIGLLVVLGIFALSLVVTSVILAVFYRKAKRREKAIRDAYRVRTQRPPRPNAMRNEEGMTKNTYVFLLFAICTLFLLFFILLISAIVILSEELNHKELVPFLFVGSGISLITCILLLSTQYRAMARYEKKAFGEKLYRTDLTVVSLGISANTLTDKILASGYQTTAPYTFERKMTVRPDSSTQHIGYQILFTDEDGLRRERESLPTPPPKKTGNTLSLNLRFVFVSPTDTAISELYRMIAETHSMTKIGYTPILISEDSVSFVRIGSGVQPYRQGLNEALYLLGLI